MKLILGSHKHTPCYNIKNPSEYGHEMPQSQIIDQVTYQWHQDEEGQEHMHIKAGKQ